MHGDAPDDRDLDADQDLDADDDALDTEASGVEDTPRTPHQRMPRVLPTIVPAPPNWSVIFGREAPLECELGFGRPHFLLERAVEAPDNNVVGIEWKGRWPKSVWDKQKKGAYQNVRAVHGNAWLLFGALFAEASLSLVVLNFPDPWWKTKHQKRRIVSDTFARQLASRLKPGGQLLIQTDVASLLEEYLARLEQSPLLKNPHGPFRLVPRKPLTASSHREKRCRKDGVPIFRAVLERVADDTGSQG